MDQLSVRQLPASRRLWELTNRQPPARRAIAWRPIEDWRLPGAGDKEKRQERTSFLKKRSKRLLSVAFTSQAKPAATVLPVTGKSFFVLFFKKELLLFQRVALPRQLPF
ncbi:MAG TPA: hypothetical protein VMB71_15315 [Acetobacteraceae bacterium]|nr:hypothetical protein [Acetobacteraceae bacterium]